MLTCATIYEQHNIIKFFYSHFPVIDDYRKVIWPLLVGVTKEEMTEPPSLDELSTHGEYNQVNDTASIA